MREDNEEDSGVVIMRMRAETDGVLWIFVFEGDWQKLIKVEAEAEAEMEEIYTEG